MAQAFWTAALEVGFFFLGALCFYMVVRQLSRGG
jgi:hypothetical protein